jgi:hypothetical protein
MFSGLDIQLDAHLSDTSPTGFMSLLNSACAELNFMVTGVQVTVYPHVLQTAIQTAQPNMGLVYALIGVMMIAIGVGIGVANRRSEEDEEPPPPVYKDPIITNLTVKCRKRIQEEESAARYKEHHPEVELEDPITKPRSPSPVGAGSVPTMGQNNIVSI